MPLRGDGYATEGDCFIIIFFKNVTPETTHRNKASIMIDHHKSNGSTIANQIQVGDVGYVFYKEFNGLWYRGVVAAIRRGAGESIIHVH